MSFHLDRYSGIALGFALAVLLLFALVLVMPRSTEPAKPSAPKSLAEQTREALEHGHYLESIALARRLLSESERASGDSLATAQALDLLVDGLDRAGLSGGDEATTLARRALRIKEELLGPAHPEVAVSLDRLGSVLTTVRPEEARALLLRSLSIREKVFGEDHPEVATSCHLLGKLHALLFEDREAGAFLDRALRIREQRLGPEHPDTLRTLRERGRLRLRLADDDRDLLRALASAEKVFGPDHPEVVAIFTALGTPGEDRVHPPAKAPIETVRGRSILENVLARLARGGSADSRLHADTLSRMAGAQFNLGQDVKARDLWASALAIYPRVLDDPESMVVQWVRIDYAGVLTDLGEWNKAEQIYTHVIAEVERRSTTGLALALTGLARCHAHGGDYAEAETLSARALAVNDLAPVRAYILRMRGQFQLDTRDFAAAAESARQSLAIDHSMLTKFILASALVGVGDEQGAIDEGLQVDEELRDDTRRLAEETSEQEALGWEFLYSSFTTGFDTALSVLANQKSSRRSPDLVRRVWDALTQSRGLVLDEAACRHRSLRRSDDPDLRELLGRLREARTRLGQVLAQGSSTGTVLAAAQEDAEAAERALAAASEEYRARQERRRIAFDDVQRALPERSAIVAYVRYQRSPSRDPAHPSASYAAFVLTAGRSPSLVDLNAAKPIEELVEAWKQAVARAPSSVLESTTAETAYRRVAERLRRAIWDPVQRELGSPDLIFLVPDGELNLVNVATLPGLDGDYLVRGKSVIHVLSAERDLAEERPACSGEGLLLVGNADFDSLPDAAEGQDIPALRPAAAGEPVYRGPTPDCGSFRASRLEPLARSMEEIDEVAAIWAGSRSARAASSIKLAGRRASEGAFKRLAPGRRIIHVASHGISLPSECSHAAGVGAQNAAFDGNTLRLSAVALAGANRRDLAPGEEDGILSSEEIATLDLDGAEWVVFSGCETGTGSVVTGEGVFGLRRAVRIAGARTLIASLWQVRDNDALEWMRRLYRARAAGASTATAVWSASRDLLETRRRLGLGTHPFYWGAFVASGDWR
jgi:CHAT domain-containing protein